MDNTEFEWRCPHCEWHTVSRAEDTVMSMVKCEDCGKEAYVSLNIEVDEILTVEEYNKKQEMEKKSARKEELKLAIMNAVMIGPANEIKERLEKVLDEEL